MQMLRSVHQKDGLKACDSWLHRVEEIENEISEIEDEYKQGTKCFIGLCPKSLSC